MSSAILVNGRASATVPATDRGLAFGDGVFRTLRVRAGRPLNFARHLRRLAHDCAALGLPAPDEITLREEIARVAPSEAVVKIIVTRGPAGRGYAPPAEPSPTRIVAAFPPPSHPPELAREGVRVRRCELVLSEQPRLAGVKTLNRIENVLARSEWRDPAVREGLLGDAAGRLVEATASNVFAVIDGRLATPALARCGVAGAARERVLDLARAAGIEFEVRDIAFAELAHAEEIFLTNSLIDLWPVAEFEGWRRAPGPVALRLRALVEADDARAD